jgi:beta-glucanase (GH16 family)
VGPVAAREEIRWYVDGHQYHTVRADDVDAGTWAKATGHGFFLLLNLAIGGALPGPPDASTQPGGSMAVDSVSVTRK